MFDSAFEREYAKELDRLVDEMVIQKWKDHIVVHIDSPVTGNEICQYNVDFVVVHWDGFLEFIETKNGLEDRLWQLKRKLMKEIYIPAHSTHIYSVARRRANGTPSYLPKRRGG